MSDRAPYFQWYPKDCDTDENVRAMDDREFGFYVRLLNHAWLNNGIPADPKRMAAIMGRTPSYIAKIWPAIAPCFEESAGRLFNKKQEKMREILQNNSKIKSAAASARWDKSKKTQDDTDARASVLQCYPEPYPDADPDPCKVEAVHTHSSTDCIAKFSSVRASRGPVAADLNGHTSQRFGEFWDRYPRQQRKDAACRQWVSTVDIESEGAVFACLERYLASDEVARGVVANPDKWLYEQNLEHWDGNWQAQRANGTPKKESKTAMLERILNDDTNSA